MAQRPEPSPLPLNDPRRGERLQRVMADAGIAARRACETLIETGHVRVNGRVCDRLPAFVDLQTDRIEVDGQQITRNLRSIYIMLNKPTKVLTIPMGPGDDRPVALQMIDHPAKPRLVPVGGLDFDSSGLLLFTNDGDVVQRLTHAKYEHARVYQAKVKGRPTPATLAELAKGVYVYDTEDGAKPTDAAPREGSRGGARGAPMPRGRGVGEQRSAPQFRKGKPERARKVQFDVVVGSMTEGNCTLEITAKHARDEEIVKALALVGHPARRLHRVAIGPLVLRDLAMGHWRELTKGEIGIITRKSAADKRGAKSGGGGGGGRSSGGGAGARPMEGQDGPAPVKAAPKTLAPRRRPRVIGGSGRDATGELGDGEQ